MKKLLTLFLFVFLSEISFSVAKLDNCPEKDRKNADNCAKEIFFIMDPNFKPAKNETLDENCKKIDKNIKCVEKYGKDCLKGFTGQSLTIGVGGFKKFYKSICSKKAPKRQEFIERTQWLNKETVDDLYTCVAGSIKNYKYISEKVDNNLQIQQGCCNYWLARDCFSQKMDKLTNKKNKEFIEKMADDTLTSLIKFLCTGQNSLEKCKKIMPESIKRMNDVQKNIKKGVREKDESFLIPFLEIVSD